MLMLNPTLHMSSTDRIRLVIVGPSADLRERLSARAPKMTVLATDLGDDVVDRVISSRPGVVILSKAIGVRTAVWICRALKERESFNGVPVMFYAFGDDPAIESAAFASGADDYVARSGTAATMVARIGAILRRFSTHAASPRAGQDEVLSIGDIQVQHQSYAATVGGRTIPLTAGEFRILWRLARNVGVTISASDLAPTSHHLEGPMPERSVRSHICSLRRKLGRRAGGQIQTVRNAGYRLTKNHA